MDIKERHSITMSENSNEIRKQAFYKLTPKQQAIAIIMEVNDLMLDELQIPSLDTIQQVIKLTEETNIE